MPASIAAKNPEYHGAATVVAPEEPVPEAVEADWESKALTGCEMSRCS